MIDLTPEMQATFARWAERHASDIIASSPWVQGNCEQPHRIVLRDLGDDWVVHTQGIDVHNRSVYFMWGSYRPKQSGDKGVALLWNNFEERCRKHLGINGD